MSHCRQLVCTQCSSKQSLQSEAPTYSYFARKKGLRSCTSWIKGRPHFSQFCSRHWTGSAFSYSMSSPHLGQKRHWSSCWSGAGGDRPQVEHQYRCTILGASCVIFGIIYLPLLLSAALNRQQPPPYSGCRSAEPPL